MFEDWVITPPCSPVSSRRGDRNAPSNSDNESYKSFFDDWNLRMFCCLGEPQQADQPFHKESYLCRNDTNVFCEDDYRSVLLSDDFGSVELFGHRFDKGSALVKDLSTLFKFARYAYMQLDSSARSNFNSLGKNISSRKGGNSAKCREDIVKFLLYVRSYIQRVGLCPQYRWMADSLLSKLYQELNSFRLFSGTIDSIPEFIINYSANTAGNKCTQPSYHLFHGHLDIKWIHITLTYQIISYQKRFKINQYSEEYEPPWDYDILENYLVHLTSDLIIIALKRFDHINSNDLTIKSCFTCTCVKELWRLLQLCADLLHNKSQSLPFWKFVNQICRKIFTTSSSKSEVDCSKLTLPQNYSCKQPSLFVLWLLKHLAKLYKLDKSELKSNYELLEDTIKLCTNLDIAESQMRIVLHLVENILDVGWEMKTEPLILFWEYFHKKLNSMFLTAGSAISGLATISKSASGLLAHLNDKLDSPKPEKNLDSFHLFLRLLGRSLRKWQDNIRFWNQIKGRIFSKFSTAKLNSLNEIGLYHFVIVFLTLMATGELHEASEKLQSFLKLLPIHKMDESRQKLIWKAHIAVILLFAERNQDISTVSNPLLDMVENCANQKECIHLMRTFSEGFQDLIDRTTNLELGQYIFIGAWIPSYLSRCDETDASRFLDSLLSLINNLNSIMSSQLPISQDSQLMLIYNNMWEHVIPYIRNETSKSFSSYHISDIAAMLTVLSFKSSFSNSVKNEGVNFFTFMTTHDKVDIQLLCRYLGQLSNYNNLHSTLRNHDIIIIKVWLRCLILLSDNETCNDNLSTFTKFVITLPELEQLFNETKVEIAPTSDCFESFLIALQLKYFSLQDFNSKNKFVNQVGNYFSKMEQWLSHIIKTPQSLSLATNIFNNVGQMFFKIPYLLYMKSRPNTLLQCFLEMLLLPLKVRDPQFKLHANVSDAIKSSLYLYICGLFKLDPQNDPYIMRSIKDLITIYVPRLVAPKVSLIHSDVQFSLIKCFELSEHFELTCKSILEIICSTFLKKKTRVPHVNACQALIFFNSVVVKHRNNKEIIKIFNQCALESVCDVIMFCDDASPCKKEAKDIIYSILDMHFLRNDPELAKDLMNVFSKLCHEHLAFASRALFDLFDEIIKVAPDLVKRFLPQFEEKIKEVEFKRGVGLDRTLRKGLEKIHDSLKNIKNSQNRNHHV